jgi:hypothetical protein
VESLTAAINDYIGGIEWRDCKLNSELRWGRVAAAQASQVAACKVCQRSTLLLLLVVIILHYQQHVLCKMKSMASYLTM